MKRIHVAAAVIRGADGQILLAKRPEDKHQGGLWEFPGGKVESGETVQAALARELEEELDIRPTAARPLIQVRHDYPDKQVLLDVWEVSAFTGEPHGAEGQPLAWVSPRQLGDYEFPAANRPIVAAARLPEQYLITPEGLSGPELLRGAKGTAGAGITGVTAVIGLAAKGAAAGAVLPITAPALGLPITTGTGGTAPPPAARSIAAPRRSVENPLAGGVPSGCAATPPGTIGCAPGASTGAPLRKAASRCAS